jgi:tetratricopeptide (TPR) repeat protein
MHDGLIVRARNLLFRLMLLPAALLLTLSAPGQEPSLSDSDFKNLDTFEASSLAKADRVFAEKDYRRAAAEYDAHLLQFPKSPATAYAILRKGRCLHLDGKRYEAIKIYNEVLDYFPNAVNYAGAALYFIGFANAENGDEAQAMKAWMEMAEDVDYRKHALAAGAVSRLGDYLLKQGKPEDAVEYFKQAAIDFRRANPEVAREAIGKVVYHYIRTRPDEPKLADFYTKVGTFEGNPWQPNPENYWDRVRQAIRQHGDFAPQERDGKAQYYRYWSGVMEGKFPANDDFQIDVANFKLASDGNLALWKERLDQQFSRCQKPGDYGRVVKWIATFGEQKDKVQEYYAKLDFAKMINEQIVTLMRTLFDQAREPAMAKNVFTKLRLDKMNDNEKSGLARYLWQRDGDLVEAVCQNMGDKAFGQLELLRYYHWSNQTSKGVALADAVVQIPQYAKEAYWIKAELLQRAGKYPEAIQAYQSADNPPSTLYRIADCFLAQGKTDQALTQLREIENFFKDQAPEAALRIAYVYRNNVKNQELYVAGLRGILTKYPKSGQSSTAHQELESMGISRIKGGVDAE